MSPLVAQAPTDRIILGLMTFGPHAESGARITDLDEYNKVLDLFQARGYNEVDTARVYVGGEQEAFTREAKWKERGLTLATKIRYPNQPGDNTADKVAESLDVSLKELGTDCVDVSAAGPGTESSDVLLTPLQLLYLHAAVRSASPTSRIGLD